MPQRFRDLSIAAAAMAVLGLALTTIDPRVPGQVGQALADAGRGRWTAPGTALGDAVLSVWASPAANNAIVAAFVVVALVLVFLMVRT